MALREEKPAETEGSPSSKDKDANRKMSRSELLLAFAREIREKGLEPIHSWEIDALLYDENGLPK